MNSKQFIILFTLTVLAILSFINCNQVKVVPYNSSAQFQVSLSRPGTVHVILTPEENKELAIGSPRSPSNEHHDVHVTHLKPASTYHYSVFSRDEAHQALRLIDFGMISTH